MLQARHMKRHFAASARVRDVVIGLSAGLPVLLLSCGQAFAHEGHAEHSADVPVHVPWGFEGARELMNLHPIFTHFPIAFIYAALVFYLLGLMFNKEHFLKTGQWTLYFATLSAAGAVWSGIEASETVVHDEGSHAIMMVHRSLGIAVLAIGALLSLWLALSRSSLPKPKLLFLGALTLTALLLAQQTDFGGRLVFMHGVGLGRKSAVAV